MIDRFEALPNGWRLVILPETDSTNLEVRRRAGAEPDEGLAVMAAVQTAGRGRRGRSWASPAGNLHMSVRLRQGKTLGETAQLSFVAAVALGDALRDVTPHVTVRFKWPNDLLIGDAKVSGILLESDGDAVIVGVGVNVEWAPERGAAYPATSLRAEGADVAPEEVARVFLGHLKTRVDQWRRVGFAPLRDAWLEGARGIGGPMVARLQSGETVSGRFVGLDADGALVMDVPETGRRRILAGDVYFGTDGGDA